MIEARINEPQREDFGSEGLTEQRVRLEGTSNAVSRPQQGFAGLEERVAFSLEGILAWERDDFEARLTEPVREGFFLGCPFGHSEARGDHATLGGEARVRREAHVRTALTRGDDFKACDAGESVGEFAPLAMGQ